MKGECPHLVFVVKYRQKEVETRSASQNRRDESWREILTDEETKTFQLLREWRAKRCQIEAVPPYILFTNRQLAELIKCKPRTLSDLEKVEGVGTAKVEKYGREILEITNHEPGLDTAQADLGS